MLILTRNHPSIRQFVANSLRQPQTAKLLEHYKLQTYIGRVETDIGRHPWTSYTLRPSVRFITRNVRENKSLNPEKRRVLGEKAGLYSASLAIVMFAASFAAVPLYRIYCQSSGQPGQAVKDEDTNKVINMQKDESRNITVSFDGNTHSSMAWNFTPVQQRVKVHPGETALAFYRAVNTLDEPVIGVATYTVLPYEAAQYFNKIQCFCFEEQMLQPKEDVFMPVLFYIDPKFSKDPQLASTDEVILSYTFFRSKDGDIHGLDEPVDLRKHQ